MLDEATPRSTPISDRLFGVMMVEKGVSRLASVDLGGTEELLAAGIGRAAGTTDAKRSGASGGAAAICPRAFPSPAQILSQVH